MLTKCTTLQDVNQAFQICLEFLFLIYIFIRARVSKTDLHNTSVSAQIRIGLTVISVCSLVIQIVEVKLISFHTLYC